MKAESCPARQKLAQRVSEAIQQTYIARHALQAAKNAKSADTVQISIALQRARSKQREAAQAHDSHVKEHQCGLFGMMA